MRLSVVASEWIAAISAPSSSKSNTARFYVSRPTRVVLESATTPRCWTSHRKTIWATVLSRRAAISLSFGSEKTRPIAKPQ